MSGCIINLVTVMNLKKQTQNMNLNNVIVSLGIESQYMIIFLTNVQKTHSLSLQGRESFKAIKQERNLNISSW